MEHFILLLIVCGLFAALQIKKKPVRSWRSFGKADRDYTDPRQQLFIVEKSVYNRKRLINKEAFPVFATVEAFFAEQGGRYRVLPELCLGAVLECDSRDGFHCVNSKRLDVGVVDAYGFLVAAIEYHGSGHHLDGTAAMRDQVKRRALQKAGIELIEVYPGEKVEDLRHKLEQQVFGRMRAS